MIIIFTSLNDPHVDAVVKELNKLSIDFIRINSEDLFNKLVSFELNLTENKLELRIISRNRKWVVPKISLIYYRRPEKLKIQQDNPYVSVQIDEIWSAFHSILFSYKNAKWLGHPHLDKHKSSKVFQYSLVKELCSQKVKLPQTIISNEKDAVYKFFNDHRDVIVKPINTRGYVKDGMWIPFFSERINFIELDKKTLKPQRIFNRSNAYFLQNYIDKKYEWRITVVGNSVYPCKIHSQDNQLTKEDWRKADYNLIRHEAGIVDSDISDFCINFLNRIDSSFGAFDFIETSNGDYYFLECNLNGQWLWIEELTGMKISRGIADLMISFNK